MSRREMGCSARGMITGSGINRALYRVLRSLSMARSIARLAALALALLTCAPLPLVAQTARADLAKARTLYNQRQFDEAIAAASQARRQPDLADMAAIVLARAHLERYREHADPADL